MSIAEIAVRGDKDMLLDTDSDRSQGVLGDKRISGKLLIADSPLPELCTPLGVNPVTHSDYGFQRITGFGNTNRYNEM